MKSADLDKTYNMFDLFLKCATNLYGFIMPGKFLSLFYFYTGERYKKIEFIDYAYDLNSRATSYKIYTNAIVSTLIDDKHMDEIIDHHDKKCFYVAPLGEFLRYEDPMYVPKTPRFSLLGKMFQRIVGIDEQRADELICAYYLECKKYIANQSAAYLLSSEKGFSALGDDDFAMILLQIFNYSYFGIRKWCHSGYTLSEIVTQHYKEGDFPQ